MFKNHFWVLEEKHDYSDDNMKISRYLSTVKLIEMTFNNVYDDNDTEQLLYF